MPTNVITLELVNELVINTLEDELRACRRDPSRSRKRAARCLEKLMDGLSRGELGQGQLLRIHVLSEIYS